MSLRFFSIELDLCRQAKFKPRRLFFEEVDSTMNCIDQAITGGAPDGFTVLARRQTHGQGKGATNAHAARKWWSGEGNLMASRVVQIGYGENGQEMDFIAACAIGQILRDLHIGKVSNKFPNDVLLDGAKIAGCLVRPQDDKPGLPLWRKVNLGIGVNLAKAPPADAMRPGASTARGTCLSDYGIHLTPKQFLDLFEQRFEELLYEYRAIGDFNFILTKMGLAGSDGKIALMSAESGEVVTGYYAGFIVKPEGRHLEIAHLCLDTGEKIVGCSLTCFRQPEFAAKPAVPTPDP